jgi:YHS domain-containing protein
MPRLLIAFLVFAVCAAAPVRADEGDGEGDSIPAAFAPFEHMIGAWKGTGIPEANRLKGWQEKHLWAWKFVKGVPVGMSLEFQGDQSLKQANLTYDEKTKQYQLVGTTPEDQQVTYTGALGSNGKTLVLERQGDGKDGSDRITIRPNSNKIRYQVNFDHQPPGAPAYKKVVSVGLTKEGESFAAGGSSSNLPKCIITGGSATMSVSFEGKSYPICCSGCRDEFTDNPTKYVKKALLRAAAGGKGGAAVKAASSSSNDSEFDGLLGAPKAAPSRSMSKSRAPKAAATKTAKSEKSDDPATAEPTEPEAEADGDAAASLLKQAEKVEKRSRIAAKILYQRLLKDYPDSVEAKTAKARLKAVGG